MVTPRRGPLLELVWRLHKSVWRVSGGRLWTRIVGMPVLELVTTGRRSGAPRSVLLTYLDHPDGFVVIASNAGDDRAPGWLHNLRADPAAEVLVAGDAIPVRAREADGTERVHYWSAAVEANRDYAVYAERAGRTIPVVVLERAS